MNILKQMPRLYSLAKTGKVVTINYYTVQEDDGSVTIVNEHGQVGGKKIIDRRNIKSGKNLGKANETSVVEQANSEMESKWKSKLDKNYTENKTGVPSTLELSVLPMLAQTFSKIDKDGKQIGKKHKIKFPCIVQRKLNGLRCAARKVSTDIKYTSRMYKPYATIDHLSKEVKDILSIIGEDKILDGELYVHGMTLQEINSRVKKYRPGETEEVEYHIYDIADPEMTNVDRDALLETLPEYTKVIIEESFIAHTEADIKTYHDQFVKEGYEGIIIRNMHGKYLFDKRSEDLQKYKEFLDEEFEIIDVTSGEGREEGAIIYICKAPKSDYGQGGTFKVRPRGSIESRLKLMKIAHKTIGKKLTVRFQEYTEDGIPSFPVGIVIRIEEDLPT